MTSFQRAAAAEAAPPETEVKCLETTAAPAAAKSLSMRSEELEKQLNLSKWSQSIIFCDTIFDSLLDKCHKNYNCSSILPKYYYEKKRVITMCTENFQSPANVCSEIRPI